MNKIVLIVFIIAVVITIVLIIGLVFFPTRATLISNNTNLTNQTNHTNPSNITNETIPNNTNITKINIFIPNATILDTTQVSIRTTTNNGSDIKNIGTPQCYQETYTTIPAKKTLADYGYQTFDALKSDLHDCYNWTFPTNVDLDYRNFDKPICALTRDVVNFTSWWTYKPISYDVVLDTINRSLSGENVNFTFKEAVCNA